MQTDVLIVGAGPVGLAMAIELTRYGVGVRIVEKAAARTDKSKALVLWSRTLEMMDRMGCASAFVAAGYKVTGARIAAGENEIAHISLSGVDSPYAFALMLPQSETERLLEEHLETLGLRVERGVELTQFNEASDGVVSTVRKSDGVAETISTAWLVGCDGAHSAVRHGLGMEFEGDTLESQWVLADVHLTGVPHPGEINIGWHADGMLAIFPITESRFRVIADVGVSLGETAQEELTLAEVRSILYQRGMPTVQATDAVWLSRFHINERKVADYRAGRVFLAGDAAHIHSPAGGQGMNTGIQDACNLAWKLALVARGICRAEPLLGSYSVERSAVGDKVLKEAGYATTVGLMRGRVLQSIRNHLASMLLGTDFVQRKVSEGLTEVAIGYPATPLNGVSEFAEGPQAGERAPIGLGEMPVGAGDTPRFVLFGAGGGEAVLGEFNEILEPGSRPPFAAGGMWLVRPDGYVALATNAGDWSGVARYLQQFLPTELTA